MVYDRILSLIILSIQKVVEPCAAKDNCQHLFLNVGISLFCHCQGYGCIGYNTTVLDDGCS